MPWNTQFCCVVHGGFGADVFSIHQIRSPRASERGKARPTLGPTPRTGQVMSSLADSVAHFLACWAEVLEVELKASENTRNGSNLT